MRSAGVAHLHAHQPLILVLRLQPRALLFPGVYEEDAARLVRHEAGAVQKLGTLAVVERTCLEFEAAEEFVKLFAIRGKHTPHSQQAPFAFIQNFF